MSCFCVLLSTVSGSTPLLPLKYTKKPACELPDGQIILRGDDRHRTCMGVYEQIQRTLHKRPVYAKGGATSTFLYFFQAPGRRPQWIISGEVGRDTGWLYVEDSAPYPDEIKHTWWVAGSVSWQLAPHVTVTCVLHKQDRESIKLLFTLEEVMHKQQWYRLLSKIQKRKQKQLVRQQWGKGLTERVNAMKAMAWFRTLPVASQALHLHRIRIQFYDEEKYDIMYNHQTPAPTTPLASVPSNAASALLFSSLAPTFSPTQLLKPTVPPTLPPTPSSTSPFTPYPTSYPTSHPTRYPTPHATLHSTLFPTPWPTTYPSLSPTSSPTDFPTLLPTFKPTAVPTKVPPSGICALSPTCEQCIRTETGTVLGCGWCAKQGTCLSGIKNGPSTESDCSGWHYLSCPKKMGASFATWYRPQLRRMTTFAPTPATVAPTPPINPLPAPLPATRKRASIPRGTTSKPAEMPTLAPAVSCRKIRVQMDFSTFQIPQVGVAGVYIRSHLRSNNRPVYSQGKLFLYSLDSQWVVGYSLRKGFLRVQDAAISPDKISASWSAQIGSRWTQLGTISLRCTRAPPFVVHNVLSVRLLIAKTTALHFSLWQWLVVKTSFAVAIGVEHTEDVVAIVGVTQDPVSSYASGDQKVEINIDVACASQAELYSYRRRIVFASFAVTLATHANQRGYRDKQGQAMSWADLDVKVDFGSKSNRQLAAGKYPRVWMASQERIWTDQDANNLLLSHTQSTWFTWGTQGQWVIFDLGAGKMVSKVSLRLVGNAGSPRWLTLQIALLGSPSINPLAWRSVTHWEIPSPLCRVYSHILERPFFARHWRLVVDSNWGALWGSVLAYVEFGTNGNTMPGSTRHNPTKQISLPGTPSPLRTTQQSGQSNSYYDHRLFVLMVGAACGFFACGGIRVQKNDP